MRALTPEECDVIEAAIEVCAMREACHYGVAVPQLRAAERDLEKAVDKLLNANDGQWKAPVEKVTEGR